MPTRRPYVYLIAQSGSINKAPIQLAPMAQYGEVRALLPLGDSPTQRPRECFDIMDGRLPDDYDPDVDFLVWAGGDPIAAMFVGILLAEREIYRFNWLRFERKRQQDGSRTIEGGTYTPMRIDLSDESADDDDTTQAPEGHLNPSPETVHSD